MQIWYNEKFCTKVCKLVVKGYFWLETRVIIKISTILANLQMLTNFHGNEAKKNFSIEKFKFKMADSKKGNFPSLPILNIFFQKFHGLVLGLVVVLVSRID